MTKLTKSYYFNGLGGGSVTPKLFKGPFYSTIIKKTINNVFTLKSIITNMID